MIDYFGFELEITHDVGYGSPTVSKTSLKDSFLPVATTAYVNLLEHI
jgi:hypothetical protein